MKQHHLFRFSLVASLGWVIPFSTAADAPAKQAAKPTEAPVEGAAADAGTIVIEAGAIIDPAMPDADNKAPADHAGVIQGMAEAIPAKPPQPYLGLGTTPLPGFLQKHLNLPADSGVLVESLDANGPAAKAGLAKDDVITKIDGKAVTSQHDIAEIIGGKKIDDPVEVESIHAGKPAKHQITLAPRPPDQAGGDNAGPMLNHLENLGGNLPPEQQKRVREAIEKAMKDGRMGGPRMGLQMIPGDPKNAGKKTFSFSMSSSGITSMKDDQGSVELKHVDGGTEASVLDHDGKTVWNGPWETAQDKAAAPQEIRDRINNLNGMQTGPLGGTFKLHNLQIQPGGGLAPAEDPPKAPENPK